MREAVRDLTGQGPAIAGHGGAGSGSDRAGRVLPPLEIAIRALRDGVDPVDAAVDAAAALEDDPHFNAGTGSTLRLDGETVQMDAAVMDSTGALGAVAAIESVRNPVRVARALLGTPHRILAGEGAGRLARALGMPEHDPVTELSRERHRAGIARLAADDPGPGWSRRDLRRAWNFGGPLPPELAGCDTIGIVARNGSGRFAAAASSGGFGPMLLGRVGDVPIPGAGLYAGPAGAVCATGRGESIIDGLVSLRVYEWMRDGLSPRDAVERGLALVGEGEPLGILALGVGGLGAVGRPSMAWAALAGAQRARSDRPAV